MRIPGEITALAIILAITAISALTVNAMSPMPHLSAPTPVPTINAAAARPSFVSGPLDGQRTPGPLANRRPIAVVLDNVLGARPQSGLGAASLTFETLTEGGITRLMCVYLENDASSVGPIRSLRPYFLDLAAGFQPILVHAGGSPASLRDLQNSPDVGNVDALTSAPQFHRDPARTDPDNLYSSTPGIRDVARQDGLDAPVPLPSLPHGPLSGASTSPVHTITVTFGTAQIPPLPAYTVEYRYDPAHGLYNRLVGGAPSTDALSGARVRVANVAVMQTDIAPIPGDAAGRLSIRVTGQGPLTLFRDGRMIQGTWQKRAPGAPLRFLDPSGMPIPLHPGPTWVEVVGPDSLHTAAR